jgi:hypothetical protein
MPPTPPTPRRILVVANETCAGSGVVDEVAYRAGGSAADVLVVAPALASSRLGHWLSADMEARTARAQERLDRSVSALRAAGLTARGELADGDPLQALDDAVRSFLPHEVIISTHPPARSNWLERRVVQQARERFDLPVTHIVVDVEHDRAVAMDRPEAQRTTAGAETLLLFHAAPYEEAMRIRETGFEGTPGVLLTDQPPEGDDAPLAFAVRLREDVAAQYEETGAEGHRRFMVPAGLVNRLGPPEMVSEGRAE